jgi:hypothetical protein
MNCPACNKLSSDFLLITDERLHKYLKYSEFAYEGLFSAYINEIIPELMKCDSCSHIFYKKMPSEELLNEMYGFKRKFKKDPARPPNNNMIEIMKRCFRIVDKKNPIFLDYGAGHGRWSLAAAKVGFKVLAYEPHLSRSVANSEFQLVKSIDELHKIKFDFIWCEQVLEHVVNPFNVMSIINKLSSKETIIRISVPNIHRAKEGADIWNHWPYDENESNHTLAPYQHIQGFNQSSLLQLASRSGFTRFNSKLFIQNEPFYYLRFLVGKYIKSLSTTTLFLKKK